MSGNQGPSVAKEVKERGQWHKKHEQLRGKISHGANGTDWTELTGKKKKNHGLKTTKKAEGFTQTGKGP